MNRVGRTFLRLSKETVSWLFVVFFLIVIMGAAAYVIWPNLQPGATLRLGDGIFSTRLLAVADEHSLDASDMVVLPEDQALIFSYSHDQPAIVSLQANGAKSDLVWLNNEKRVVYIVKNVSETTIQQYIPTSPARYIVELPAGTVRGKAIAIGDQAVFNETNKGGFGE